MKNFKNIFTTIVFSVVFLTVSAFCIASPVKTHSESERRPLAQFPETSGDAIISGQFSKEFESFTTDQFPYRDAFRSVKSYIAYNIFNKKDNNGLFFADGHISKIDAQENEQMMTHAEERFRFVCDKYLKGNKIYLSIVPDKNFLLAKENGYPSLNYESFIEKMKQRLDFMEYIDVTKLLTEDDFYRTDTHWRQEKIIDVANHLMREMGNDINGGNYTENTLSTPFYGVYSGQFGLPTPPDTIKYLTNNAIDSAIVTYYDTGVAREGDMYNMEKANGKDPYEMFLSGTMPVVTLENINSDTERELILFRDSYGSSIAPLLLSGYKKITLVDIRYIKSDFLGAFCEFDPDADVLFLYSTTLLNNSLALQ